MYDYLDEIRYSPKKKKSVLNKAEKLLRKNKVAFAFILAGVILGGSITHSIVSDVRAKKEIISKFELIEGVALDNVKTRSRIHGTGASKWVYLDNADDVYTFTPGAISDTSVDVDLNGDGVKDVTLHLGVKTAYKNLSEKQIYAMMNIKKGSRLLLEGVVDRDENGRPVNLRYPNNGTSLLPDRREIVDEGRGRDYIDMQNLIRVDGCQLQGPKNKENKLEAPNSHLYFVRALKLGKSR